MLPLFKKILHQLQGISSLARVKLFYGCFVADFVINFPIFHVSCFFPLLVYGVCHCLVHIMW